MENGDKQTKRGRISISTYGILRPCREKFNVRPENVRDLQEMDLV